MVCFRGLLGVWGCSDAFGVLGEFGCFSGYFWHVRGSVFFWGVFGGFGVFVAELGCFGVCFACVVGVFLFWGVRGHLAIFLVFWAFEVFRGVLLVLGVFRGSFGDVRGVFGGVLGVFGWFRPFSAALGPLWGV